MIERKVHHPGQHTRDRERLGSRCHRVGYSTNAIECGNEEPRGQYGLTNESIEILGVKEPLLTTTRGHPIIRIHQRTERANE